MITIGIIIVTCITSLLCFNNEEAFNKLCLHPYVMYRRKGELFRFVTVGFVHADLGHLLFNMLTLWFFGKTMEGSVFSEVQYLFFYISALALSSVNDYVDQKNNPNYRSCGASGAVSAVLFSLVLYEPWGVVYLKFIIPIYFVLFAVFYIGYSYYMSKKGNDNIGHGAHLWGALYGIAYTLILKPESLSIFLDSIKRPPFL